MEQVVEITNLLNNHVIKVLLIEPTSYIKPFLSESANSDIILIHKLVPTTTSPIGVTNGHDFSLVSELDLTGNPLECPFSPIKYEDTLLSYVPPKNWRLEEENHSALPVAKARSMLSLCNLHVQSWMVPVWVVCDGADSQQTVLLSSLCVKKTGWVTSSIVQLLPTCSYKEVLTHVKRVKMEHHAKSRMSEDKVKLVMTQTYDDCISTWSKENDTANNIKLSLSWSCSSIDSIPPNYAQTILEMLIAVEQPFSLAYSLWKQLKLLNELITLLASLKGRKIGDAIQLPKFGDGHVTGRADILNFLHESYYTAFCREDIAEPQEASSDKVKNIYQALREAVSGESIVYQDITHSLFLLLA
ncbi:hypothetical protein L9F63_012941, partial [Diploptera punctata]